MRSPCPIANALDLLGDRWTLLVVRDLLLFGKRRFGELAASPERIPTNILTDRLRRLTADGIIEKTPYRERPVRHAYTLTAKGRDLFPVLRALIEWSAKHVPAAAKAPPGFLDEVERQLRRGAGPARSGEAPEGEGC